MTKNILLYITEFKKIVENYNVKQRNSSREKKKQYQPIHFLVTFFKKERILQRADSVSARYMNPHNLH